MVSQFDALPQIPLFYHIPTIYHYFFFWPYPKAWNILIPWSGIEPASPAVEVQSLNCWTAREVPVIFLLETLMNTWKY